MTTTRGHILEEAARLFTQKGYEAASMQELANALGLSKAAPYHHFHSKEDFLLEISLGVLEGLLEATREATTHPDPEKALRLFMEAHARYFEERHFFL